MPQPITQLELTYYNYVYSEFLYVAIASKLSKFICIIVLWGLLWTEQFPGTFHRVPLNHLGHVLLTNLLFDRIKDTPSSRIVIVSSHGRYAGSLDFDDMLWKKRYQSQFSYFRSKLANVMFARELSKRLEGTCMSCV